MDPNNRYPGLGCRLTRMVTLLFVEGKRSTEGPSSYTVLRENRRMLGRLLASHVARVAVDRCKCAGNEKRFG